VIKGVATKGASKAVRGEDDVSELYESRTGPLLIKQNLILESRAPEETRQIGQD
jgi:hypothetical protein